MTGIVAVKVSEEFTEFPLFVNEPLSNLSFLFVEFCNDEFKAKPSTVCLIVKTYVEERPKIGSKYSPSNLVSSPLSVILSYVIYIFVLSTKETFCEKAI